MTSKAGTWLAATLAVAVFGWGSVAGASATPVLTVEKLGGPEVNVNDVVVAKLETGRKVQFVKTNGETVCNESGFSGKVTSNPVSNGTNKAEIKIESSRSPTAARPSAGPAASSSRS